MQPRFRLQPPRRGRAWRDRRQARRRRPWRPTRAYGELPRWQCAAPAPDIGSPGDPAARAQAPTAPATERSRRMSRPSAASPIVPVTTTRSPGRAPARRTILPCGTAPSTAIDIVIGPAVRSVSPPNSGQRSEPRPRRARARTAPATRRRSPAAAPSVSRNPSGRAPLAARSDRFTRNAFFATVSGGSSGKKCMPPTMPSVLSTRSQPGGGAIAAASSSKPKAPGWVASGLK